MMVTFSETSDEELARLVIAVIAQMEAQGARLPNGWRHQPISLSYLDALHELATDQVKAMTRAAGSHVLSSRTANMPYLPNTGEQSQDMIPSPNSLSAF